MECFVRNPEFPVCSELIFGITLLVESSKVFVWTGEIPNPVNCRLQALRLAGELRKGIDVVLEMEKDESIAKFSIRSGWGPNAVLGPALPLGPKNQTPVQSVLSTISTADKDDFKASLRLHHATIARQAE
jgi:hypothetical protein